MTNPANPEMDTPPENPTASLLTANTTGAIAVIRVTGRDARQILDRMFTPTSLATEDNSQIQFGRFEDDKGIVDEGLVSMATDADGVQLVDINVHGGLRITERILAALSDAGCTITEAIPKKQTPEKLPNFDGWTLSHDTEQALACCQTRRAVRFVARQSQLLRRFFDELEKSPHGRKIKLLIDNRPPGQFLIHGASVAVIGPPNAGKSTLINALADGSETLVSPEPGTTRDWTEVSVSLDGVPIRLIDTAGVRSEADELERDAIQRGMVQSQNADVQLLVLDRSIPLPSQFLQEISGLLNFDRLIVIASKSDLSEAWSKIDLDPATTWIERGKSPIQISGLTGVGMSTLAEQIVDTLGVGACDGDEPMLFTSRQVAWLSELVKSADKSLIRDQIRRYVGL